jgi:hypothetical protein
MRLSPLSLWLVAALPVLILSLIALWSTQTETLPAVSNDRFTGSVSR